MFARQRGCMSETVLVTGGFGLVGSATVRQLAAQGRRVMATDLDTAANRKAAERLPAGVRARWADLTQPAQVDQLIAEAAPTAVIHLAASIPPTIYRYPRLARRVNVDATAKLVRAVAAQPEPARWVQASSNAVYGARNPHRVHDIVRVDTPLKPCDLYSGHKFEAEQIVRSSTLDWVVLRLGGVLSVDPAAMPFTADALYFESALPTDGRLHSVDVRDVATAFANATSANVVGETFLIAGDDSHKVRQGEVGGALAAARGLPGVLPPGRPGNPDNDVDWFITDWMDSAPAQQALSYQHHSWSDMLAEMAEHAGWKRHPMRLVAPFLAPVARMLLERRGAYRGAPGQYADPWGAIRRRLGEPGLDAEIS
jgi:nucleoside-diphosphate-sugar epimerase